MKLKLALIFIASIFHIQTLSAESFTLQIENRVAKNTLIGSINYGEPKNGLIATTDTGDDLFLPSSNNDVLPLFSPNLGPEAVLEYKERRVVARRVDTETLTLRLGHYINYCDNIHFLPHYDLSNTNCNPNGELYPYTWPNGVSCQLGDDVVDTRDISFAYLHPDSGEFIGGSNVFKTVTVKLVINPNFILTSFVTRKNAQGEKRTEVKNHSILYNSQGEPAYAQCHFVS